MASAIGPLFPDELAWSGCGRLKRRYPHLGTSEITRWVSGDTASLVDLVLPRSIMSVAKSFEYGTRWRQFLQNHTFWPWIAPFLTAEARRRAEEFFCAASKPSSPWFGPSRQCKSFANCSISHWLRACPECAAADEKQFGSLYWHRHHQFLSISKCHRHGCALLKTNVGPAERTAGYAALTWSLVEAGIPCASQGPLQTFLRRNIGKFLSLTPRIDDGARPVRGRLRDALIKAGLQMEYSRWVTEIHNTITARFSRSDFGDEIEIFDWERLFGAERENHPAPVHALILCSFLGITPEQLFDGSAM